MNSEIIIEIFVTKHKEYNCKTYYEIIIITNDDKFEKNYIKIYKRYSDFLVLDKAIRKHIDNLIDLPSKQVFTSDNTKNKRKNIFAEYLKMIITDYKKKRGNNIPYFKTFKEFLLTGTELIKNIYA